MRRWLAGRMADEPQQLALFGAAPRKPVKREVRALVTPRNE